MKTRIEAKQENRVPASRTVPTTNLLAHQASLGELLRRAGVRPKLEVGSADDPLELEADRIADQVMTMEPRHEEPGVRLPITHESSRLLRRKPGEVGADSWSDLVKVDFNFEYVDVSEARAKAQKAVKLFLAVPSGSTLINRLWTIARKGGFAITVIFTDDKTKEHSDDAGHFDPARPDERHYQVTVYDVAAERPGDIEVAPGHDPWKKILRHSFKDPASSMAETLYHELLHIWFLNDPEVRSDSTVTEKTGHGDVEKSGEEAVEPRFLRKLSGFVRELGQSRQGGTTQIRRKHEGAVMSSSSGGAPGIGSGAPLDDATCRFMEDRFGYGFGHVLVHHDPAASELARTIDARAFTLDNHIVFGANQYAPGTAAGNRLIAHELAHIVQQQSAVSDPGEQAEKDEAP